MTKDESFDKPDDTQARFTLEALPFAFLPLGELRNYIKVQCVKEEVERISEIVAGWHAVQNTVAEIVRRESESQVADTADTLALPSEFKNRLIEIAAGVSFQKTFGSLPTTFEFVKIDTLVAAQRTVNLDFVQKLVSQFPPKFTMRELIEICLSPRGKAESVPHLEVNPTTHAFTTGTIDFRFLGCFLRDVQEDDLQYATLGGLPTAAIVALVGYGLPVMNVYKIGGRLILNNGFHRAYALRSQGVREVPVLVQHVTNPALEVPLQVANLSKEYLLRAPRPVLIKDFFEPSLTLVLKTKNRQRVVTVGIAPNQYELPA